MKNFIRILFVALFATFLFSCQPQAEIPPDNVSYASLVPNVDFQYPVSVSLVPDHVRAENPLYQNVGLFKKKTQAPSPIATDDPTDKTRDIFYLITGILLSVYEVVARLFPTTKSYSIITWIVRILRMLLPDVKSRASTISTKAHL
jgi:hypothetical protein